MNAELKTESSKHQSMNVEPKAHETVKFLTEKNSACIDRQLHARFFAQPSPGPSLEWEMARQNWRFHEMLCMCWRSQITITGEHTGRPAERHADGKRYLAMW